MQASGHWSWLPLVAAAVLSAPAVSAIEIDWVTVGDPGNAADTTTNFGAVAYTYRMAETEVTNSQYADFLNAVASADPNTLYDTRMSMGLGGITRSGTSGSYTYSVVPGRGNKPVGPLPGSTDRTLRPGPRENPA